MIKTWTKTASETLISTLTFIVFKTLDLLDALFCIVYALLDNFFDGEGPSCYCGRREIEGEMSESLYGRKNVFRKLGLGLGRRKGEKLERKGQELRRNRWSDCGCESCVSWMKIGDVDDLKLFVVAQEPSPKEVCKDLGDNSTENVIFLHGFLCSSSFWVETVFNNVSDPVIKHKYRLFAIDLLGFGKSPKPRNCAYTLKDHVEMVEKSVIWLMRLESFHLVAHSMGCVVALAVAAKYARSVKSVTLVAPPYFPCDITDPSQAAMEKLAGKRLWPPLLFGASFMSWYEHLGRTVCFIICRNHQMWERAIKFLTRKKDLDFMVIDLTRHTHHSAWHSMHNVICGGAKHMEDYLETLNRCQVKIKVFHGARDQVVPLECSFSVKMKVPSADVEVIPQSDHTSVVLARPKDFTHDLERFWMSSMESNKDLT